MSGTAPKIYQLLEHGETPKLVSANILKMLERLSKAAVAYELDDVAGVVKHCEDAYKGMDEPLDLRLTSELTRARVLLYQGSGNYAQATQDMEISLAQLEEAGEGKVDPEEWSKEKIN